MRKGSAVIQLLCALALGCSSSTITTTVFPLVPLVVQASGQGSIAVNGAVCFGGPCTTQFPAGTSVTLLASPKPGNAFLGWSGACSGLSPVCELTTRSTPTEVGAVFESTEISIAPMTVSLVYGAAQRFVATVNGASAAVSWSVEEGAAGGAVDSSGDYVAPASSGTFHVVATRISDSTDTGSAEVVVTAPPTQPPGPIAYQPTSLTCMVDTPCALAAPVNQGGPVVAYAVSPELPAGLSLDTATGAISGTASTPSSPANYVVTAANSAGSASASISLSVVPTSYTIRGTVSGASGSLATVLLSGQQGGSTQTDASGNWQFSGLASGNYTVTAEKIGAYVVPFNLTVSVQGADVDGQDFVAYPDICTAGGWCWESPLPEGRLFTSVWGSSANDVWAVGEVSTVLHFDGNAWLPVDLTQFGLDNYLDAVWGSSNSDVWIAGVPDLLLHFDGVTWQNLDSQLPGASTGQELTSIWGSGPDDIWIGTFGALIHGDGSGWQSLDTGLQEYIDAIWGSSSRDVWAVGNEGGLAHFDGSAWSQVSSPVQGQRLSAIWGSGPDDVWSTPSPSGLIHFDGTSWTVVNDPAIASAPLSAVFGTNMDDVWFAGSNQLAHWNGASFATTSIDLNVQFADFTSLWMSSPQRGVAVGLHGQIYQYDGAAWTPYLSTDSSNILGMFAGSPSDLWAVSEHGIFHSDGVAWSPTPSDSPSLFLAISGSANNDIWAVGAFGYVSHWDGSAWSQGYYTEGQLDLSAVWVDTPNDAWALSTNGEALHWDGTSWSTANTAPSPPGAAVTIWGSGQDDVWAAGAGIFHFDGTSWTQVDSGAADPSPGYLQVWGTGPGDVWAVGGAPATARHWDGTAWSVVDTGHVSAATSSYRGVGGTGTNDVWIVSDDGSVLHFDGQTWTPSWSGPSMIGICATGPGAVWAYGAGTLRYLPTNSSP